MAFILSIGIKTLLGTQGRSIVQILILSLVFCLFYVFTQPVFHLKMKTCTLNLKWHVVEMHCTADFEG